MMAASSKFDLSSSSSDRSAHLNVQRGSHAHASLEGPGSFRRASENLGPTSHAPRGPLSSQVNAGNLLQILVNEMPATVLETPFSRTGEVKRSISSIIGASQDDTSNSTPNARPLLSSSFEEIRRLKSNITADSSKARYRAKVFGEAAVKLSKRANMSKKRSRTDILSVEKAIPAATVGSASIIGSHNHFSARNFEIGLQKQERTKQNKKVRTSYTDEWNDGRLSKMARPSSTMERDKDVLKLAYSSATPPEEKCRPLPTKRKRSSIKSDITSSVILSRAHDCDGEASKQGLQPKATIDSRSRLTNVHGFRANGSEENYAASPTTSVKNTSAQGPRPNPKTSSPGTNSTPENSDDWERTNSKFNRKRTVSVRASSPHSLWCEPKIKKARAGRRSNLPPVAPNRDEYTSSDTQSPTVNDDSMGNMGRSCTAASLQSKPRNNLALPDCDDYGATENKSKNKIKRGSDIGERTYKAAMAGPSRKNKMVNEEGKKHRKTGRGAVPSRSGVLNEKVDVVVTAKQMRTPGVNHEKIESKIGRPLTKKLSDRKGHSRPKHPDTPSSEFAGESDDDQEELLAAAKAALDSVRDACLPPQPPKSHDQKSFSGKGRTKSRSFWEQNEDYFAFLSVQDQDFLVHQINISDEVKSTFDSSDHQNLKGGLENSLLSPTPKRASQNFCNGSSNETTTISEHAKSNQSNCVEPFIEESVFADGVQTGLPISQILLSAIIDENEMESLDQEINIGEEQTNGSNNGGWNYQDELLKKLVTKDFMSDLVSSLTTTTSSPSCTESQYAQMSFDEKILLELNEIGIFPDPLPCLAPSEDEDIDVQINRLTGEYQEQASKEKEILLELEKVVKGARESQGRELGRIALDKLVERAYEKYITCFGPKTSGSKNSSRANKQATLGFIARTLTRCKKYEETGTSCFCEPPFKEMFDSVPRNATSSHPSASDHNQGRPSQPKENTRANNPEPTTSGKEDQWSNKLKQKELLLDEVVGSATDSLRASPLTNSTKGKRSNKKPGRPPSSNPKPERKSKSKPKQKPTPVRDLGNGNSNATESPLAANVESAPVANLPEDTNFANDVDFGDLGDFGGQGQDIGSWLNIELDGSMLDNDFVGGLEIPMDDLSEVF